MNSKLFDKLAETEKSFLDNEFLAPVIRHRKIRIKINNIIMELNVHPKNFQGWAIFKSSDYKTATRVRNATNFEREAYLSLFPVIQAIVVKKGDQFFGVPLPDNRFKITGEVPISMPVELENFDTVYLRYDGQTFWFERKNYANATHADYLRESLAKSTKTSLLSLSGLLAEHTKTYDLVLAELIREQKLTTEGKIKDAVTRGGGIYKSFVDRGSVYSITYEIDGRNFTSTVDTNLNVQSAGICLSGGDRAFDLQSLMSVIREGENRRLIHRYDYDYDE